MKLLNVDTIRELQIKLDTHFSKLKQQTERVSLRQAKGRYLAEPISADMDVPVFRRSIVDGFAVRAEDTFGVSEHSPILLKATGVVKMGSPTRIRIQRGEAAYVPTGGMVPDGADAVVMIEHVELLDDKMISVNKPAAPNSNLMNVAEDFASGQHIFDKGHRIKTKDIGMLAACGKASLLVYKRPTITIVSTGDELVGPGEMPSFCEVRDINSYALAALVEATGAEVASMDIVGDQFDIFQVTVADALKRSDVVLISGGSSAGNKDLTEKVIASLGNPGVISHGLAIKPGKPTIVGVFKQPDKTKAIIGLPGHPMAAILVFDAVIDPFLRKYYFTNQEEPRRMMAVISENVHAGEGRETYQLVRLERLGKEEEPEVEGRRKARVLQSAPSVLVAHPIRAKSGSISQLLTADGYVVLSADSEGIEAGRLVEVVLLGEG